MIIKLGPCETVDIHPNLNVATQNFDPTPHHSLKSPTRRQADQHPAMRVTSLLFAALAASFSLADPQTIKIAVQPVSSSASSPNLLAEVTYDTAFSTAPDVTNYEPPEIPEDEAPLLLRVGVYDAASADGWVSSTSVVSAENFAKGFKPTIVLSTDIRGQVVGVSCRGVAIDAGQTRDFGPAAVVVPMQKGKQPELNKPVVLSPQGKKVVEEEKTLFQK